MKQWKWFVYIIECFDGLYYTGVTYNIDKRMEQHKLGKGSKFTSKHGFKELKYVEEFNNLYDARQREIKLKEDHVIQSGIEIGFPIYNNSLYYEVLNNE